MEGSQRKQQNHRERRQAATTAGATAGQTCTSLYTHPAADETVNAYDNYNIQWNCDCLTTHDFIDITLYTYGGGALHQWQKVPCATNSLTTQFKPTWWNNSLDATLQLQISESGQPSWASTAGPGPAFNVAWNGTLPSTAARTAANGTSSGISIESVSNPEQTGGVSGGKLAATVTVPLLAAALAVGAYILYSRRKGKGQRKRWSAYVDHRLSQVSAGDLDPADLSRPSMSMSTHARQASLSGRPISTMSGGANFAGVGSTTSAAHSRNQSHSAASGYGRPTSSFFAIDGHSTAEALSTYNAESPSETRPTPRQIGHGDRVSRVSFAESGATGTKRATSYFSNGPGTASSPNHHRYKDSLAKSTSSIRNPHLQANAADDPFDTEDIGMAHSMAGPDDSPSSWNAPRKHNITVSTSMPAFTPSVDRQSILSPDDLLKAYASSKSPI